MTKPSYKPTKTPPDIAVLPDSAYITVAQLAAITGHAPLTVKGWHRYGRGPKRSIVQGRPRFMVADVRTWLAECETPQYGAYTPITVSAQSQQPEPLQDRVAAFLAGAIDEARFYRMAKFQEAAHIALRHLGVAS
jgi:hypothetical protein